MTLSPGIPVSVGECLSQARGHVKSKDSILLQMLTNSIILQYFIRRLAEASWVLSTMSNNTALLITLLYWICVFDGGPLTFVDFFLHALQVSISRMDDAVTQGAKLGFGKSATQMLWSSVFHDFRDDPDHSKSCHCDGHTTEPIDIYRCYAKFKRIVGQKLRGVLIDIER
jgi:hypothetical protein